MLVITLGFSLLYPIIRALPGAECGFLHFENLDESTISNEFCGDTDNGFINLEEVSFPVKLNIITNDIINAGYEANFTINFQTLSGKNLKNEQLAKIHTEKIHLLIIDPSLQDYHHKHPQQLKNNKFSFSFTPKFSGDYFVFAELALAKTGSAIICRNKITVSGESQSPDNSVIMSQLIDGISFDMEFEDRSNLTDTNNYLTLRITSNGNTEVPLEKVMGAYAHLVAFDESRKGFAHMHPLNISESVDPVSPRFEFLLNTKYQGYYKIWAQVRIFGKDIYIPFGKIVNI